MALVTIQRSPSTTAPLEINETDGVLPQNESINGNLDSQQRSISECYFAVKGAALVLPQNECVHIYRTNSANGGGDIQQHLQSMFYLLRLEDTLKMAVKLESFHSGRMRYLVVVSCTGEQSTEESCLLGIDCNDVATIGLVLPVWADTLITLDGDGGFSVSSSGRHHIFKPVSVQAMWSALQTLHKASAKAREYNYFMGGFTHSWIEYYEQRIQSDRSCLNEWHAMDDLESKRPPSPDSLRSRPAEREGTERYIRLKLKEIMMSVDLDEVTSKYIRVKLEEDLNMDLHEYKSFIDQEMIIILGQMDAATEIFDYLYLGSEWNASNLEELQRNGVGHILNVTREIDNFFPGMFDYLNVRVYDEEGTELLKHWDKTFKFIEKAKSTGSKVLVHCKMGVSRSASVVIAYAMKAYDWNMQNALEFVKNKRTCIKPNGGFLKQLEIYQGVLDASKHRHNMLWRSKSETNLKSPPPDQVDRGTTVADQESQDLSLSSSSIPRDVMYLDAPSPSHRPKSWSPEENVANMLFPVSPSADDAIDCKKVEKSRSPDEGRTRSLTDPTHESVVEAKNKHVLYPCRDGKAYSVSPNKALHLPIQASPSHGGGEAKCGASKSSSESVQFTIGDDGDESPVFECRNPLYVAENEWCANCDGGNHQPTPLRRVSSVKDRISELELQKASGAGNGTDSRGTPCTSLSSLPKDRGLDLPEFRGLVLNLANQFECGSKPNTPSPSDDTGEFASIADPMELASAVAPEIHGSGPVLSQTKLPTPRHQAVLVRPETWANEQTPLPVTAAVTAATIDGNDPSTESAKQKENVIMKVRVNNQSISNQGCKSDESIASSKASSAQRGMKVVLKSEENRQAYPISRHNSFGSSASVPTSSSSPGINADEAPESHRPSRQNSNENRLPAPGSVPRRDDPFSVHLDRVFEREERTIVSPIDAPSRQSSFGSVDSAIVLQAPGQRESPSRQSSWGSVDSQGMLLSRESSWGSADCRHSVPGNVIPGYDIPRKHSISDSQYSSPASDPKSNSFPFDPDPKIPSFYGTIVHRKPQQDQQTKIITPSKERKDNQGSILKRTNSFDGTFPKPPISPGSSSPHSPLGDLAGDTSATSPIQRSQSLRADNRTRCLRPNLQLHGPIPYRSPGEKLSSSPPTVEMFQIGFPPKGTSTTITATTAATHVPHYASFPSLTVTDAEEEKDSPSHPQHSTSQPNMVTTSLDYSPPHTRNSNRCRTSLRLDFGGNVCKPAAMLASSRSPTKLECDLAGMDGAPIAGIVKTQRQVLESKMAVTPGKVQISTSSGDNNEKNGIRISRVLGQSPPQLQQLTSPDADDATATGKVRRITKEIESKAGSLAGKRSSDRLVIVDQQGKEVSTTIERSQSAPAVQTPSPNFPDTKPGRLASPLSAEDISVKSLVGKFEVPKDHRRTRYHSENEAEGSRVYGLAGGSETTGDGAVLSQLVSFLASPCSSRKRSVDREETMRRPTASAANLGASPPKVCIPISPHPVVVTSRKSSPPPSSSSSSGKNVRNEPHTRKNPLGRPVSCTSADADKSTFAKTAVSYPHVIGFSMMPPTTASKPPQAFKVSDPQAAVTAPPKGGGNGGRKVRKLHHGKTHPLNKLAMQQRHPNPLYNTM